MRILKLDIADFKSMPWKNGKGFTTELIIDPPWASVSGDFCWRLSMARVSESAPFSCLVGVDRTILILEGNGIELDFGVYGKNLLSTILSPVTFKGEWDTYGRLLDGPCLDFNVMTKRESVAHSVFVIRPNLGPVFLPRVDTVLVFCVKGNICVVSTKEAITFGELLRFDLKESDSDVELVTTDKDTILIVVSITIVTDKCRLI